MSVKELLEMTESSSRAITNMRAIRDKIFEEFDAAATEDERCALLEIFAATMDVAESHIAESGDAKRLAELQEARADDYPKLLLKETSVGGGDLDTEVSPEMLMRVTNREIAAGRLRPDDSIRQVAVQQAAAPAERWLSLHETEAAEARKSSDTSIESLRNELLTTQSFDIVDVGKKITKEFRAAVTSDQRGTLLAIFKAVNDEFERQLAARHENAQLLERVRKARADLYKIRIYEECTVGGNISVDMLMAVTNREIAAGRMNEDHSTRKIAIEAAAAPHFSHAELVARHAKLKAEAAAQANAPATAQVKAPATEAATDSSKTAYGVGAVLGRKL